MKEKLEQMKKNPYVTILMIISLSFGGGNLAIVSKADEKQQKIDSLTIELTRVSTEVKQLKKSVERVESSTQKKLEKLEEKQDKIIDLIIKLKK